jgi:manganese-dependent inorganic pyrophosphatase
MSDTLILRSPTTTKRDHTAATRLAGWALGGDGLPYESYRSFGEAVLAAGAGLAVRDVESIVNSDLKVYEGGGIKFGVAQVEVANLHEVGDRLDEIKAGLEALCKARGLGLAVLMVTDVVRGSSRLVLSGHSQRLLDLPYTLLPDGTLDAPELVSRKKQLLPAVLGLLE